MFIYLASPYTHESEVEMERRYELACQACAEYFKVGKVVYSPIAHWHPIAVRFDLPLKLAAWMKQNKALIQQCLEIHVLCIEGWKESKGVRWEMDVAMYYCKAVRQVEFKGGDIHEIHNFRS